MRYEKSLSFNSILVTPDLSRRRKHFLNKKKEERERERFDCKLIFSLFLLLTLEQGLVSYSDRMTEESERKKLK